MYLERIHDLFVGLGLETKVRIIVLVLLNWALEHLGPWLLLRIFERVSVLK